MEELDELKMMTNNDLKKRCDELEKEYTEIQNVTKELVEHMFQLSKEYNVIKEILNKREGKNG